MARSTFTKEQWLEAMRLDGEAFRAAAIEADPNADVPSCPGWTVAMLIHHVGSVYRYVNSHVARSLTTPPEKRLMAYQDEPPAADPIGWWNEQYSALLATLEVLDPDVPAWNWAPSPKRVAFWQRRMAQETAIHRWDVQIAIGRGEPIEPRLAADGISEVLDTMLPAGHRREPASATGLIALSATDVELTWYVRLRGEGIALLDTDTIFDDDEHRPIVTASGSASDLHLALWGRVGFDVLDTTGDEDVLSGIQVG